MSLPKVAEKQASPTDFPASMGWLVAIPPSITATVNPSPSYPRAQAPCTSMELTEEAKD